MAITESAWVCTRSSTLMLWLLAWWIFGAANRGNGCIWLVCLLWGLYPSYWVILYRLDIRTFSLTYGTWVWPICLLSLKGCSFLKRKWREKVDPGERGDGMGLGVWSEGKLWLWCTVWEKNLFAINTIKSKTEIYFQVYNIRSSS